MLKLPFVAFIVFLLVAACGEEAKKREAAATPLYDNCGDAVQGNGKWFRECVMFGRTCIVGSEGSLWCTQ